MTVFIFYRTKKGKAVNTNSSPETDQWWPGIDRLAGTVIITTIMGSAKEIQMTIG